MRNLQRMLFLANAIGVSDLPTAVQSAVNAFTYTTASPQTLSYTEVDGGSSAVVLSGLAALAGAVFTGAVQGVTPVANADLTTKEYVDGLIITPTHTTDQYLAVRTDTSFGASDFTGSNGIAYAANEHTATVPNTGLTDARLAIARLATDPDLVYIDINASGVNSLGAFAKQSTTFTIGGSTYEWWLSNQTGTWDGLAIQAR